MTATVDAIQPPLMTRHEPGRVPAALLAVAVHGVFLALLIVGISWQVKPDVTVSAEIWTQLPDAVKRETVKQPEPEIQPTPPPEPTPVQPVLKQPPVDVPPPLKADINIEKQKRQEKLDKQRTERELAEKKKREEARLADERKKAEEKQRKQEAARQKAEEARLKAEAAERENALRAARESAISSYGAKIAALIRSRANIPDTVVGKPVIEIRLRLLVTGTVFDAQVVKASGNRVYDEAVERAINGIRQWPLPDNPELLGSNRTLNLNIQHEQ